MLLYYILLKYNCKFLTVKCLEVENFSYFTCAHEFDLKSSGYSSAFTTPRYLCFCSSLDILDYVLLTQCWPLTTYIIKLYFGYQLFLRYMIVREVLESRGRFYLS